MAIKTKTFTLLGFIFTIACLIALVVSFASDRWVESTQKEVSGFKNLGLWSACFEKYLPPPWALIDKYYDGCWWVLDKEMDDLRHYLFPSWFVGTQVMVTLGLVFQLIAIIIMIINAINCFPYHVYRNTITLAISLTAAILHLLTGILLTISIILFGAKADNERQWLERPDQNYLSWGFGICVLAAFLAFISTMCQFMEFVRFQIDQGKSDEPVAYLTNKQPPGTNYAYAPAYTKASDTVPRIGRGHPAYVDKYSNHGSHSSLNAKPPDTMFAVSGAGEVYINGLADFDENRQRGRNDRPYSRHEQQPHERRNDIDDADYSHTNRLNARKEKYTGNDYEESKQTKHAVLPEYKPTSNGNNKNKTDLGETSDDSYEEKKKIDSDSDEDHSRERNKKSESTSTKKRSHSEKGKKKSKEEKEERNKNTKKSSGKKSKKHYDKDDESDEDRSRRRSRKDSSSNSKKRSGRSRSRSHSKHRSRSRDSKHRSRSRDLNSSYSDSERGSVRGRSKKRYDDEDHISRKDGKRRSASEKNSKGSHRKSSSTDGQKKKRGGHYTDESGSEFNSRLRSKQKLGDWSDVGSERKTRRDFSDSESMRSKSSRRPGDKPKGTYSSYYEY